MSHLRVMLSRLRGLRHQTSAERELQEELATHRALLEEEAGRRGLSADEARRRANLELGNGLAIRESMREQAGIPWLESVAQDIRYALRSMRKGPVAAAVVVLSLALGIGANTAIFSLVNAVMLRQLPVQKPDELRLVLLRQFGRTDPSGGFTNPLWEAIRAQQDIFSSALAWSNPQRMDMAHGGTANYAAGMVVSGSYFGALGIRPATGRLLSMADDVRSCPGTAVLSYGFWQSHFGGAEEAVGSTIELERKPFQVIGVAGPGFHGVVVGKDFDVAIPLCASAVFDKRNVDGRGRWWLNLIGRLKPGISDEQMNARLGAISPGVMQAAIDPEDAATNAEYRNRFLSGRLLGRSTALGPSELREEMGRPLAVLMGMVALVLLIACANIASLMLARATSRGREIAIRNALGASRGRIVRQLLTESLLLSLIGAGLGLLLARWGGALIVRNLSTGRNPLFLDLALDGRALAFTVAVGVLTGMLVGLGPALRSTRVSMNAAMKDRSSGDDGSRLRFRPGQWIVGGQVALSLGLLIACGLLLRTFVNLATMDIGFDRSNVLVITTKPPWYAGDIAKGTPDTRAEMYDAIGRRLAALPGVQSLARAMTTPMGGDNAFGRIVADVPGGPTGDDATVLFNFVTPNYFRTLRMHVRMGRGFNEQDQKNSPHVAIVSETLARKYFPGMDPLGHRFHTDRKKAVDVEVVGVVKDAKYQQVAEDTPPTIFEPATQAPASGEAADFVLRTAVPPAQLIAAAQKTIAEVDPELPLEFHTLKEQVDDDLAQERLLAQLSGFFGGLALVLAMIGLYGVLSYLVNQRQVEFGIRMALGARPASILRMVMSDVAVVLVAGTCVGLGFALAGVKLLRSLLFGVQPRDMATIVASIGLLAAMALLAGYLPARRATKVDPLVALRYE